MLLDYKNKFSSRRTFALPQTPGQSTKNLNVTESNLSISIPEQGFSKWGNVNMYRTSYHDMSNRVSYHYHHSSRVHPSLKRISTSLATRASSQV